VHRHLYEPRGRYFHGKDRCREDRRNLCCKFYSDSWLRRMDGSRDLVFHQNNTLAGVSWRRRNILATSTSLCIAALMTATASTKADATLDTSTLKLSNDTSTNHLSDIFSPSTLTTSSITVPLIYTGQELLISYKVDDSRFRAVLDTGSPFLMVPGSCGFNTQQKSGCYRSQGKPTGLETTVEIFDGFEGEVEWRRGHFDFVNVTNQEGRPTSVISFLNGEDNNVIFGVASEGIMGGPGGVFFGLIKHTDRRIRPSFLGQTQVQSFQVDLRSPRRTLTLSNEPMIDSTSAVYIPMTNVLRRRYGDPVGHYTARARSITVNGYHLLQSSRIYVIFDTGVTGMLVSRGLFNEQYTNARKRKDKSLFGNVTVSFDTQGGGLGDERNTACSSR
jgi:hypothetical protein